MAVIARVQPGQGRLDVLLAHRVVGQQGAGRFVTAHQGAHRGVGGLQDGFRRAQSAKQQLAGDSADARRVDQPQPGGQGFVVGGGGLGNVRQGAHRGTGKGRSEPSILPKSPDIRISRMDDAAASFSEGG